jgi:glutamate--cysteine ligase
MGQAHTKQYGAVELITNKVEFENFVTNNWRILNEYIDEQFISTPAPPYSSVDIREGLHKFAPIDNNLFPAGFNNICDADLENMSYVFSKYLKTFNRDIKKIGIITESHTKNLFYLDHLSLLGRAIRDAGVEVTFISFDETLFEDKEKIDLVSHSQYEVSIHKAKVCGENICVCDDNTACFDFVLLNNDQSHPINVDWEAIKTLVLPTPHIGWFRRQKGEHFKYYDEVVQSFCNKFKISPDLIMAKYSNVEGVDFSQKSGLETLANEADAILKDLEEGNSLFVKAGQGTYGMGISVVHSGTEILGMNRKTRNKMDVGKNKIKFTSVLIQEGIDTVLKYDHMPAEVTIYLIGGQSVGGFMRANSEKSQRENLNSRGMVFKKFCISEIREKRDHQKKEAVYSVLARLSTLASGLEIKNIEHTK